LDFPELGFILIPVCFGPRGRFRASDLGFVSQACWRGKFVEAGVFNISKARIQARDMFKHPTLIFGLLLAMLASVSACQAEPKVAIATKDGKEIVFQVEIADTPSKREMGLQYRHDLADDKGMIFLFPTEAPLSFWMKNTPIPLDMLFINGERKIVGIVEQATPFTLEPRAVAAPSKYVLEINGGLAKLHGFKTGDGVRFDGISPLDVRE
jgi:uncharacterized membrane protein (UPF0127 family)